MWLGGGGSAQQFHIARLHIRGSVPSPMESFRSWLENQWELLLWNIFHRREKQPQKQPLRAALGCKMNCKQLVLLCLLYKCLSDETQAIMEACFVVPAVWLSLGRLAALPVTFLFKRKGSTSILAGSYWPLICWGIHPKGVLSISTFQQGLHFSEMSIPLRNSNKWMTGVCISSSTVTIAILPSYLGPFLQFQKAVWYLERRNLVFMSLLQHGVPGAEKPFESTTCPSTAKPGHDTGSLARI